MKRRTATPLSDGFVLLRFAVDHIAQHTDSIKRTLKGEWVNTFKHLLNSFI
jgi:very-short-patch-repair endonuclease